MKSIMQSLSSEDRVQLQEQMSALPQEDRKAAISQMKEVDPTAISSDEYLQSLLDMITPKEDDNSESNFITEVYA
jgi:hypothetical protein